MSAGQQGYGSVAAWRGKIGAWRQGLHPQATQPAGERSSLRAIGEFLFRVVKWQFNFRKVGYRGLFKNSQTLTTRFALASLYRVRRRLLTFTGSQDQCAHGPMNGLGRSEKPPEGPFWATSVAVFSEPFVGACKKSSGWLIGWKKRHSSEVSWQPGGCGVRVFGKQLAQGLGVS